MGPQESGVALDFPTFFRCAILPAMFRTFRHLLIAFALLFGQHAAQQHAFYHAGLELAGANAHDQKGAPQSNHGTDRCLSFQAVGSALTCHALTIAVQGFEPPAPAPVALPPARSPRIHFESRAPPHFFS